MKHVTLIALAAATAMTGTIASAQGGYQQQQQGYQQRQQQYQQDLQQNQQEHRDYREARRQWERGQRLPSSYRSRNYMVSDYRSHGWNRPPRGYAYYNTDNGDVVMAAIATGVIASIISNSNDHREDRRDDNRGYGRR